jgi:hypothetical protein
MTPQHKTYNDRKFQGVVRMTATREKLTLRWRRSAGASPAPNQESEEFIECAPIPAVLVKAIEIQPLRVDPWVEPEALDICLECWKIWMGRHDSDLGAQQQKLRGGEDDGRDPEKDSESVAAAAEQRRENEIAEATDAAVNNLRACDRWAIYKMCGVSTTWKFPLLDFMQTAIGAKIELEKKLRLNIATRALFG